MGPKILIAMDSFKGSIDSFEAGQAVKTGILRSIPDVDVKVFPFSDGGEGTTQVLYQGLGGELVELKVKGPYNEEIMAQYLILPNKITAVIEMAEASGIAKTDKRDPKKATTYGVGEMILDAVKKGITEIIMGIGGSATNDAGLGMLRACGYQFLDQNGIQVGWTPETMHEICSISDREVNEKIKKLKFRVACDVKNPLYGKEGATYIYGMQKGLKAEELEKMDQSIRQFAKICTEFTGISLEDLPGSGAAGGLGYALASFFTAELISGSELVLDVTGLKSAMVEGGIFITGEGCIDEQSCMGKGPLTAAKEAKKRGMLTIGLTGNRKLERSRMDSYGLDACFSIASGPIDLKEAMEKERTYKNLLETADEIASLLHHSKGIIF